MGEKYGLLRVKENRKLLNITQKRKGNWMEHIMKVYGLITIVLESTVKVEQKRKEEVTENAN